MTGLPEETIKPKLDVLALAKQLKNVSKACKIMGYSRDSFYRFKRLYEAGGEAALHAISRHKPNEHNRVAPYIESEVLSLAIENPVLGQYRVANALKQRGISISPGGVRSVWLRHGLETFKKRVKALEAKVAQEGILLTESQRQVLEKVKDI